LSDATQASCAAAIIGAPPTAIARHVTSILLFLFIVALLWRDGTRLTRGGARQAPAHPEGCAIAS
jgi:hypothetical protein